VQEEVIGLDEQKENDAKHHHHQQQQQLPALTTHHLAQVEANIICDQNVQHNFQHILCVLCSNPYYVIL